MSNYCLAIISHPWLSFSRVSTLFKTSVDQGRDVLLVITLSCELFLDGLDPIVTVSNATLMEL